MELPRRLAKDLTAASIEREAMSNPLPMLTRCFGLIRREMSAVDLFRVDSTRETSRSGTEHHRTGLFADGGHCQEPLDH